MTTRRILVIGLLIALLLAGIGSYYASSSPDGLEKVAADQGISASAKDHQLTGSPFADYGTKGVADSRLSTGLAGTAGVVITLALGSGLVLAVRRRDHGSD
jgi:hypothetical protein